MLKIGPYELRKVPTSDFRFPTSSTAVPRLEESQLQGAFSMKEEELLWRALMQVFEVALQATEELAEDATFVPNECVTHVAARRALKLLKHKIVGYNKMLEKKSEVGSRRSEVGGRR